MNPNTMTVLEFDKVIDAVKAYALSGQAQRRLENLTPETDPDIISQRLEETSEACAMLERNSAVPLSTLENMDNILFKSEKGIVLSPEELTSCLRLLESVRRIRRYMDSMAYTAPNLASYACSMFELEELREDISRSIVNNRVDDRASHELAHIRRKMMITEDRIKQKLNDILRSSTYAPMLQDALISTRNGRYVLPVRRQQQKSFPGQVLDISATGATVFMEPAAIVRWQEELNILRLEEANEEYRILSSLSQQLAGYARELNINIEAIGNYDFIFAKAKYSRAFNMTSVSLNNEGHTIIKGGRHPLLGPEAIPLDFHIGEQYRALVITGPNTGGKTVALKTIGLLTLMVQSGLHVPVAAGSVFAVFADILADIGDGQSIAQSLSTFSAHVKNILTIIKGSDPKTLVIMDELGAGTDPAEGRGFALAVLEEVFARGAVILASTHFGEIKDFAQQTPGFENGCMTFDQHSLKPLYELKIGSGGDSNAFLIALKLGIDPALIERAHEITYGTKENYHMKATEELKPPAPSAEIEAITEQRRQQEEYQQAKVKRARREQYKKKDLKVGDCVYISTMARTGIVYEEENSRGDLVVLVLGKKYVINNKRLSLHIDREELYPENYDMDIVFESKENRKKRKKMGKRHIDGLMIEEDNQPFERGD